MHSNAQTNKYIGVYSQPQDKGVGGVHTSTLSKFSGQLQTLWEHYAHLTSSLHPLWTFSI